MRSAVCFQAFLVMVLLASFGYTESFPPEQEKQIRAILEYHYAAWNEHDPIKMAEIYATDGDLRSLTNEWAKNRNEVEKLYTVLQNTKMKHAHINYEIKSIKMIKPDVAFVDVESEIKNMETTQEKKYPPLHHDGIFVLVQRDGKWQILIGRPF